MNNLADKTFLSGVFDFAEAMADPQRNLQNWYSRAAQSFVVPNIIGQMAWKTDPYIRESRGIIDRIRSRIPGEREELNAVIDPFGQPAPQSALPIPGLPFNLSQARENALASAMLELGLFKGKPGRTLMGVKLDSDTYRDYATQVGQARLMHLTPYVKSPQFQALMNQRPEVARYMLEKMWDRIGSDVRLRFQIQNASTLGPLITEERAKPRAISSSYISP